MAMMASGKPTYTVHMYNHCLSHILCTCCRAANVSERSKANDRILIRDFAMYIYIYIYIFIYVCTLHKQVLQLCKPDDCTLCRRKAAVRQ